MGSSGGRRLRLGALISMSHPASPDFGESLRGLLQEAGVTPASAILVTGPSGLSPLLWLCRHGYEHVGYLRSRVGCGPEPADALLIAHTCDAAGLEQTLLAGPPVRVGGALIFQCRAQATPFASRLLQRHGYRLERCLHGSHRDLMVARRQGELVRKAA